MSAHDGHIWKIPWIGGTGEQVSAAKNANRQFRHYLHGIAADGESIAFVGTERLGLDPAGTRSLWISNLRTGVEHTVGKGFSPADGPELAPDGKWLYFNSEINSTNAGHAQILQIFRCDLAGCHLEQLTSDDRANWFPHILPNNTQVAYLSFPARTVGHPPDRPVVIRLLKTDHLHPRDLVHLTGGQGTLNVNSWSPDSTKLAYIAYPLA